MESTTMIVTSVLSDFFSQDVIPAIMMGSCKTLRTLLKNAIKETTDPKKLDVYRKVRLSNPKVRERIVEVPGALDIMGLAGFSTNGEYLVYAAPSNANELVQVICNGLQIKMDELEEEAKQKEASTSAPSPFLSDEERRVRYEKSKAARRKRDAERAATQQRWEEDKVEREEAARRREAKLKADADKHATLVAGIRIRSQGNPRMPLATPMEAAVQRKAGMIAKPAQPSNPNNESEAQADKPSNDMEIESKPAASSVAAMPASKMNDMEVEHGSNKQEPQYGCDKKQAAEGFNRMVNDEGWSWGTFLEKVPRCCAAEGVRDSSTFRTAKSIGTGQPKCLKRLFKELDSLDDSLPFEPKCSIWIRFDEETPQFLRAMIVAPLPGPTPYSGGLFCFDIFIPDDYPNVPPKVVLLTTGGGRVRFGPNLYADGKVCLSLLGTWPGPKWNPSHSTLYQVLISIQGLILGVEHPYYLEPGHGGWEGRIKDGDFQVEGQTLTGMVVKEEVGVPAKVVEYEDALRVGTVRFAMLEALQGSSNHLAPFAKVIEAHFYENRNDVMTEVRLWSSDGTFGRTRAIAGTTRKIDALQEHLPKLEGTLHAMSLPSLPEEDGDSKKRARISTGSSDAPVASAVQLKDPPREETTSVDQDSAATAEDDDVVGKTRQAMEKAASAKDFVRAGQLQEELQRLEELVRLMKEAASAGNFIRAGRLQEQLKALAATESKSQDTPTFGGQDDDEEFEDEDDDDDDDDDDDMPMGGGISHAPAGLGTNVFAPANYLSSLNSARGHSWGAGSKLVGGEPTMKQAPTPEATKPAALENQRKIAHADMCSLRLRLPWNESVVEDFHKNDPLLEVYTRLESKISFGITEAESLASYNLICSHPKRTFNLETDGSKTLLELNLTPSATVVVMKSVPQLPDEGSVETTTEASVAGMKISESVTAAPIPYEMLCRLRVRLPDDRSVVEDFNRNDPLSAVYLRLDTLVPDDCRTPSVPPGVAARVPGSGAFSQPLSSAGYTLLLSHPKREFSLEMHGTRSLAELNLAPSATLTVMKCRDRGIVHRGELESRLREAQGNAMELDGLTYEGLVELTERVGGALPAEGEAFVTITEKDLEANSEVFSPSNYLSSADGSSVEVDLDESERRCPICLGEYDAAEEAPTLRKLTNCSHVFHNACLATWLGTKSSCPLCKTSIAH